MTAVILRLPASADFQVRSGIAIRRDQALVNCAFSFCWAAWSAHPPPSPATPRAPGVGGGEMGSRARRAAPAATMLATAIRAVRGLAGPADCATALVAGMVQGALAPAAPGPDDIPRGGPWPAPLRPALANHPLETPGTTAASRRRLQGRRHGSRHSPPRRQGGQTGGPNRALGSQACICSRQKLAPPP